MFFSPKQRVTIAAVALGTGLAALALVPRAAWLRERERGMAAGLAGTVAPRPFELTGTGSPEDPWTMVRDVAPAEPPAAPRFLSVTDEAAAYFETNPPSPADWAVILDNLQRRGHRSIAITPVLAWSDPDPIAFSAVDSQLERFRPAIAGMPVVRGISPEPIPPAFQRFSLPATRVDGDFRSLPIVNQLAVTRASLGRTRAVAAFTRLESEQAPDFEDPSRPALVPLLARWDDRVVFSLPLAVTMVRFSVSPDELRIRPGRELRLGAHGPVIPIDLHGRAQVPALAAPVPGLPVDDLIDPDRKQRAYAPPDPAPWVVRDERSRMTPDDRETSRRLADVLVCLAGMPRGGHRSVLARPHTAVELTILLSLALAAGALAGLGNRLARVGALAGLAGAAVILLLVLARCHVWQPALATLVTPLAGALTAGVQAWEARRGSAARAVLTEMRAVPAAAAGPVPEPQSAAVAQGLSGEPLRVGPDVEVADPVLARVGRRRSPRRQASTEDPGGSAPSAVPAARKAARAKKSPPSKTPAKRGGGDATAAAPAGAAGEVADTPKRKGTSRVGKSPAAEPPPAAGPAEPASPPPGTDAASAPPQPVVKGKRPARGKRPPGTAGAAAAGDDAPP